MANTADDECKLFGQCCLEVNTQQDTYVDMLHTPIYRFRLHKLLSNDRAFSICLYQTEKICNQRDYFNAHSYIALLLFLGKRRVCGPMGPTAYKNVDSGHYFWPSALKGGHVWVTDAVVQGCARDVPGMWRRGGREEGRERDDLPEGPASFESQWLSLCVAGCSDVRYISMEGDGRGCDEEEILFRSFISWMKNKRRDIPMLDSGCEHYQWDEKVWGQKCLKVWLAG